jgi:activating signal cointegrator 1
MTMKCLSLWQPWATLIAIGAKKIETRSWATNYRGPIVIHAAKTKEQVYVCAREPFKSVLQAAGVESLALDLPYGKAICVVDLVDCIRTEKLTDLSDQERAFGNYQPRRFGWLLANPRPFKTPILMRGMQGLLDSPIPIPLKDLDYSQY